MNAFLYLLTAALLQNFVLSTGFGSSMTLRLSRRPLTLLPFGGLLAVFSALSVAAVYPLDKLLGSDPTAKLLRPLLIIAVVSVLYILLYGLLKLIGKPFAELLRKMLPTVAFNNVTVGVLLIINHQFALPLVTAIALSFGTAVGFTLLSLLIGDLRRRLDNPDVPVAFRGLPLLLVSLGLLALGLMGFSSSVVLM